MVLNHAVARNAGELLRYELQNVGHNAEVGIERAQSRARLLGLEGGPLLHGDARLFCGNAQWVRLCAGFLWGAEDARHRIAPIDEGLEDRLPEILLSYDGNAHASVSVIRAESRPLAHPLAPAQARCGVGPEAATDSKACDVAITAIVRIASDSAGGVSAASAFQNGRAGNEGTPMAALPIGR